MLGSSSLAMMFETTSCAGDLLMLLNVSSDEKILPTTYGELKPPLGKHRLKVRLYSWHEFYVPTNIEYLVTCHLYDLFGVCAQYTSDFVHAPV